MIKVRAKIEEIIGNIVDKSSYELVDIAFNSGKKSTIEVFIWKSGGVSISDCRRISREISDELDIIDLIDEKYYLVVSSPGLDRPLKTIRDYERSIGESVKITLADGKVEIAEILSTKSNDGKDFVVLSRSGNVFEVDIADIKKCRIQITP